MLGEINCNHGFTSARFAVQQYSSLLVGNVISHIGRFNEVVHDAIEAGAKVNHFFAEISSKFLLVNSELRLYLFQSFEKVLHLNFQFLLVNDEFFRKL
jgi:hypothetical protein